jgi:autotransporter-associated beta strand protein
LGDGGTSGSILGNVSNDATLAFNRSDRVSFNGTISGGGAVRQIGTGTTVLTADNTYSGGTTITAGTLAGSASSFGTGAVLDNSALIIDQRTEAAFSNPIDGTGSFTKSGAGSLDLTGASALTGATNVVAGRLTVSGSLARSIVTVRDGATLGGMGTVGGIVALGGATVAPGNPMGTLNVKGEVSLAAGSVYQVTADAAGQSDRIATSGAATISGGEVRVLAVSGEFAPTNQYTILAASAGITGRFASVTSNFAFLTPALSYGAAEVRLSLARSEVSFTSIGRTRNQIATAAAAERLGAGNAIYDAILPLDAPSARTAFDALSGEVHASIRGMQLDDGRFVRDAAVDRLWAALGDGSGAAPPAMAYGERGPEPAARSGRFVLWGRAFGARGEAESDGNAAGTRQSGWSVLLARERRGSPRRACPSCERARAAPHFHFKCAATRGCERGWHGAAGDHDARNHGRCHAEGVRGD